MSLTILFVSGAEHGVAKLATLLAEGQGLTAVPRVGDVVALPSGYYGVLSVVWNMVDTEGHQRVSVNLNFLDELEAEPMRVIN